MRILVVFLILTILVSTVGFAWWLHSGKGPADQKIQTFLSYSLSTVWVVQGFLTIFISTATVSRDLKNREIYTIASKPISRGKYLVGKCLGLMVLNLVLLLVSGGLIYSMARGLERIADKNESSYFRLKERVFIARKSVQPPLLDVSEIVEMEVEKRIKQRMQEEPVYQTDARLVQQMRQTMYREIEKQQILKQRTVSPGAYITWHFEDIKPVDRENGVLFIRYKHDVSYTPPDSKVISHWVYGPADPAIAGGTLQVTSDVVRTVHELAIPVSELSDNGQLYVSYQNPVENGSVSVIFPPDSGIEVLYVAGGFEANYIRNLLLLYCRLSFLSILGVAMGAWLSFPVAVLMMMVIFILGVSSSFILDAMRWEAQKPQQLLTKYILMILPRFSAYDPIGYIEKGRFVSWGLLSQCVAVMVLIKGGLAGGFGYLVFKFRELARVIV